MKPLEQPLGDPHMLTLDLDACRNRQQRLLGIMRDRDIDLVILNQLPHVQWLTGVRFGWMLQPLVAMDRDGHVTLVSPNQEPTSAAIDAVLTYDAQWLFTLRNDQRAEASRVLMDGLTSGDFGLVATEYSSCPQQLVKIGERLADIEPDMYGLRRRKDADELALLRMAIGATEHMYRRARDLIRPGISELEMFSELQTAAVDFVGELLTGTGNDYQCASLGGPPRHEHFAQAGQLYILDLGPAYRGYFADNCRTLAVTEPTRRQQEAWSYVVRVFELIERDARPGVSCRQLFQKGSELLEQAPVGRFIHHLGHGIGLFPHEAPHLNPNWDDSLEVGDVFTVEPGLYAPELNAGLRIENDYLVTDTGVERLTTFSDAM